MREYPVEIADEVSRCLLKVPNTPDLAARGEAFDACISRETRAYLDSLDEMNDEFIYFQF